MNNKKIVLPLVAVIVLLVAGVVYLGYSLSQEKQVNKDMQELAVWKMSISNLLISTAR